MSKLLILGKKGGSFRLFDVENKETYRAFQKNIEFDLTVGSLIYCSYETEGGLIEKISVEKEIVGDSDKKRVLVCVDETSVGDLVDNVPVMSLGKSFGKNGKKMAYAYFKLFL